MLISYCYFLKEIKVRDSEKNCSILFLINDRFMGSDYQRVETNYLIMSLKGFFGP